MNDMNTKKIFKSKLWLFPLGYILFYTIEAIADVFYEHGALYIYIIFIFLSFFILFILALIKSFKTKTNAHWLAVTVAFLLIFFWQDIRSHTPLLFQALKIKLRPQIFSECVKNATPIPDGGAIGVCEYRKYMIGTELGIYTEDITEAIIYDSSGNIINDHAHRSCAWNQTAYTFRKKVPFGQNGYKATKLFGHYYYVYFSTHLSGDFRPEDFPEGEGPYRRRGPQEKGKS